jgi:hypothetical protein
MFANTASPQSLSFSGEEAEILTELLESERATLLVGIRHTDHRAYRDELRRRLALVEQLSRRIPSKCA